MHHSLGANNGDQDCTTTNAHTSFREIQVECNSITVYNNTRANETSNVLSLLKYTKEYADSVGKYQLFVWIPQQGLLKDVLIKLYITKSLPHEKS